MYTDEEITYHMNKELRKEFEFSIYVDETYKYDCLVFKSDESGSYFVAIHNSKANLVGVKYFARKVSLDEFIEEVNQCIHNWVSEKQVYELKKLKKVKHITPIPERELVIKTKDRLGDKKYKEKKKEPKKLNTNNKQEKDTSKGTTNANKKSKKDTSKVTNKQEIKTSKKQKKDASKKQETKNRNNQKKNSVKKQETQKKSKKSSQSKEKTLF